MREWELRFPDGVSEAEVIRDFEDQCGLLELACKRLTLQKFPGCTHWHLTKLGQKGTLEATYWPRGKRWWLSVHGNREADWQTAIISELRVHAEDAGESGGSRRN